MIFKKTHAADYLNIKLMKTGGIHNALKICEAAEKNGVKCLIGCMKTGPPGIRGEAHRLGPSRSAMVMMPCPAQRWAAAATAIWLSTEH